MHSSFHITLFCVTLLVLTTPASAFGAGDIADFSYLNGKAFRHGDIENVLENISKVVGMAGSAGLLGFAKTLMTGSTGGNPFSKSDIKHVYFGNWLRDYSQAMDIAGLSKLSAPTLVMVVSVLAFMEFGFATAEYEVTADKLGVYLPVEHIDNPKGYAEREGDARNFHPKLRPPVDPEELEIDERTGMKKYMASEGHHWDTSAAHIRRTFEACIRHGRRAGGKEGPELWEAYRLLGTGLHTLEDLLAHSNWCEIGLRRMGYKDVFCHVGDRVIIDTPNGPSPPLVTGTFGSADFIHSLMGEATDHLSAATVVNLTQKMNDAQNSDNSSIDWIRNVLTKVPGIGGDEKVQEAEDMKSKAYHFNPDDYASEDVQRQLMSILTWRDDLYREVTAKIEMIPGLENFLDDLTNALNTYVYSVVAPWLSPILQQSCGVLSEGSKAVIDTDDQYEVFNNPHASDPSHSLLSKDHFALILNEPAGKIAQIVVQHTVNLIVTAWFDEERDIHNTINAILEAFHHPFYATGRSEIQNEMMQELQAWLQGLGTGETERTIQALSKESVKNGGNKRLENSGKELQTHPPTYPAPTQGYQEEGRSQESYDYEQPRYGSNRYNEEESSGRGNRYGEGESYRSGRSNQYNEGEPNNYSNNRYREKESYSRSRSNIYGHSEETHYSEDNHNGSREYKREASGYEESQSGYRQEYGRSPNFEESRYGSGYQPGYDAPRSSRYQEEESYRSRPSRSSEEGEEEQPYGYQSQSNRYQQEDIEYEDNSFAHRQRRGWSETYGQNREAEETFGAERLNLNEESERFEEQRGYF